MSILQVTLCANDGSGNGGSTSGQPGEDTLDHTVRPFQTSNTQLPTINAENVDNPTSDTRQIRQHRASIGGKKVIARTLPHASSSSLNSLSSQRASSKLDGANPSAEDTDPGARSSDESRQGQYSLFLQVFSWLQNERTKLAARRQKVGDEHGSAEAPDSNTSESRTDDMEFALDQLERILAQYSSSRENIRPRGSMTPRQRAAAVKKLRRGSHSDSDYTDTDQGVPSADVTLDNSKALLYSGGEADSDVDALEVKPSAKDRENWLKFKFEVVRLVHTLGLKGWRRVPLEVSGEVEVVRLSGALTNAVYVVSPPKNLPMAQRSESSLPSVPRKPPPKLLLRVYGPQVEHLIDRERELQILRRLGKRNIGPRVLGTFNNGRFEQYFHAKPLTTKELRVPETSKQISKRMRELHDGIDLLPEERESGPSLWKNWDKWVGRCEKVTTWLDQEILNGNNSSKASNEPWRWRGFVCCVPWQSFRAVVDRYRKWLEEHFGGAGEISKRLVFAHNDTQYGNLLRLQPSEESPLLLPANEHKQLIVIDFEYASANMRGVEFANHFTEWCYNYHDAERPWACHTNWYPTQEEQERFIRAYLRHQSGLTAQPADISTPPATHPSVSVTRPTHTSSPRVPPFLLDTYVPGVSPPLTDYENRDPAEEAEVQHLLHETRLWRVANSVQWIAWGIVQAHVPGMNKALSKQDTANIPAPGSSVPSEPEKSDEQQPADYTQEVNHEQVKQEVEAEEAADEFDYLAYAQDRALFFWSDLLALGFIKEEELPADMIEDIKKRVIDY
ncbi:choline kinase [Coccidioides immitis RS]|uniref:Choline kinase n=3 Tax=Coccidioides immitis TaxID=5501 RepID=J3KAJ7_COCIM|nr:choline kinase [Coccidioides immitis RS]EAS32049.3 choline kinase [Coccidioides immitis RS]KMP07238.1 choline kinase [Coccidioides immitis RMSCC 2394]KMU82312.1 choline kinase [Coccidioides immitis H538.4]TPX19236.1 hypothetical protein DIZ76_017022 [Coccidioides immitis]